VSPRTVLVVGGTGSIGRLVVARLVELGHAPRVLTRHLDRARSALPAAAELVSGDVGEPAAVAAALDGVDAVVMTHGAPYGSGDYEAVDYGAVPVVVTALGGRSVHVVLMSSIGVTGEGAARDVLDWKRRGERVLRASGLPYTVVRPGWFDAGTGREMRADLRQGDTVEYGPVRREHVAEVLVQALLTSGSVGRTLEVFSAAGDAITDWTAAFAGLDPDPTRNPSLNGAHDAATLPLVAEPARVRAELDRIRPN
jgi:uncharacterized protein YbjT (DUF2867 family)